MRELLPIFLHLRGRRVVLVGAGPVGASKLSQLLAAGADVRVVAPDVHPDVAGAPVESIAASSSRPTSTMRGWWWRRRPPKSTGRLLRRQKRGAFS